MSESRTAAQQQRADQLCEAAVRALSGESRLRFRAQRPYRGQERLPIHAPHLYPARDEDFGSLRGAADGVSMRLKHSDADLHRNLRPTDPAERLVFELLEQFRTESLATVDTPGISRNLRHRHVRWSLGFHHSGLNGTSRGILLYTVVQICRSRVTAEPVVAETESLLEETRFALVPRIGHDLDGLRRKRHDQTAYAEHARAIARVVGDMLQSADGVAEDRDHKNRVRFPLLMDDERDSLDSPPTGARDPSTAFDESDYRVFTTSYDEEHLVSTIVRTALLKDYREQLDQRIAAQKVSIPGLVRKLRDLLTTGAGTGWDGGQEEGRIDGRLLTQLVTSPTERRLFRRDRVEPVVNCVVTFLVDCSGSMKEHAEPVAMLVDVLARALELAGASSEILGFTTGSWNGGRPMRDWRRAGRPDDPGRLNERRHLVFKDADTSWRRSRTGIAALLKTDLFREGVDGEAVEWACQRAENRAEQQRLLIVLSDGSPMDSATSLVNNDRYLDKHLVNVLYRTETTGSVRIYGLGLGLDLSPYYGRSRSLDLSQGTGKEVFGEILAMLAESPPP